MGTVEVVDNFHKNFRSLESSSVGLVCEKSNYDSNEKKKLLVEKRKLIREQLKLLIKRSYPNVSDLDLKKYIPGRKLTVEGFRTGEIVDDRYKVEKLLDSGSMGNVYLIREIDSGKVYAMKTLVEAVHSEKAVRRFIREAKELSRLGHKHIINVTDFGISNGRPYYIMENLSSDFNVDANNMDTLIKMFHEQKISLKEMLKYFAQIAEALDYLHTRERTIIHRDLKPSNVIVNNNSVKVIDFGLVSVLSDTLTELTNINEVLGTAHYFAVTDWDKGELGPKSDVYSLGVMLYYLVTKRLPFDLEATEKEVSVNLVSNNERTIDFIPSNNEQTVDFVPQESDMSLIDTQISKNTPGSGYRNKENKDSMLKLFRRVRENEPAFENILPGINEELVGLIKRLISKNLDNRPDAKSVAQELYRIEGSTYDPTPVYSIMKRAI